MQLIYWLILLSGAVLGVWAIFLVRDKRVESYLTQYKPTKSSQTVLTNNIINFTSLSDRSFRQGMQTRWQNIKSQLGVVPQLKIVLFSVAAIVFGLVINQTFFHVSNFIACFVSVVIGWWFGYRWLQHRELKQFDETFPDALNMLTSSISAGESIGRGIVYVGNNLDSDVGREFKVMGERLKLGESIDEVFRKSCRRFPNANFYFFVITLRANMERGGQLKEVMSRLNRQMFEARAIERKKYALTSEARASAKIVCAVPFFFLFILQFLSPENYEFIMFNPEGRPLLYYLVISEAIGMGIIWALMKRVK